MVNRGHKQECTCDKGQHTKRACGEPCHQHQKRDHEEPRDNLKPDQRLVQQPAKRGRDRVEDKAQFVLDADKALLNGFGHIAGTRDRVARAMQHIKGREGGFHERRWGIFGTATTAAALRQQFRHCHRAAAGLTTPVLQTEGFKNSVVKGHILPIPSRASQRPHKHFWALC